MRQVRTSAARMTTDPATHQSCTEQGPVGHSGPWGVKIRAGSRRSDPGLMRPPYPASSIRPRSPGFVARAVARLDGRHWGRALRRIAACGTLALMTVGLLEGAGVQAQNHGGRGRIRAELAESGIYIQSDGHGIAARANAQLDDDRLSKLGPLLATLGKVRALDLSEAQITSVEPLRRLTTLRSLDISGTKVVDLEPLKGLVALRSLDVSGTDVASLEPLARLTALRSLDVSGTDVASLGCNNIFGLICVQQ